MSEVPGFHEHSLGAVEVEDVQEQEQDGDGHMHHGHAQAGVEASFYAPSPAEPCHRHAWTVQAQSLFLRAYAKYNHSSHGEVPWFCEQTRADPRYSKFEFRNCFEGQR
jgi:hypothetical protein